MFPDARAAPVHKDGSFTLVSSGLKDHLEDKLYNSMRTGAEFKKCIQEAFAMVRTEQVTMLDESRRATMFLPLSVMLLGRPSPFVVLDADITVRNNPDGSPLAANAVAQRYTELPTKIQRGRGGDRRSKQFKKDRRERIRAIRRGEGGRK